MPDHTPTDPTASACRSRLPAGTCRRIVLLALCTFFSMFAAPGFAGESAAWKAVITEHPAIPPYLIAVDKSRQELAFFERRSPLTLSRRFACTTGQATGDKETEGDLKTPEGIYFVGYRIGSGLDFIKYGHEAYTLNYPNPVDRLRRKTGYGIWIHGRGEPLVPLQTEGCVSMNNGDLALLGKALVPGAPVALTDSFSYGALLGPEDKQAFIILRDKVEAWAKAWSDRSRSYFSFYDKDAYSIAQGEPFSAFQAQKERLFTMLPWIRTTVRDVQVLRGPDYWVTWFYQDYQAPNLQTRGVRRLYWGKDAKGEFKILGMEWHPGLNTTLVASADALLPPLEQQGPLWPDGVTSKSGTSGRLTADAGTRRGAPQATDASSTASAPSRPSDMDAGSGPNDTDAASGSNNTDAANAPAQQAGENTPGTQAPESGEPTPSRSLSDAGVLLADAAAKETASSEDHIESSTNGRMARPSPEAVRIGRQLNSERKDGISPAEPDKKEPVSIASSAPAKDEATHPLFALPPALPTQGIGGAAALPPVSSGPVATAMSTPAPAKASAPAPEPLPASSSSGPGAASAAPADAEEPVLSAEAPLPEKRETPPAPAAGPEKDSPEPAPIVSDHAGADWLGDAPRESAFKEYTAPATPEFLASWIEAWRIAWLEADLDEYMAFYASDAKQGSRSGAASIRKQKARLWAGNAPSTVELTDIDISITGKSATAVMRQRYQSANGKGDFGQKTLSFTVINGVWLITQEDWSSLPHETGD